MPVINVTDIKHERKKQARMLKIKTCIKSMQ